MTSEPSVEEKARKVARVRRIVGYRKVAGVVMAVVGLGLLVVGLREQDAMLIALNGALFAGYGSFMFWQARRAQRNLGG